MANNTKKKHSAARKLIPAAGMLAVSAAMLASSTYAWFTMNKTVEVTGMQMKAQAEKGILINEMTGFGTISNVNNGTYSASATAGQSEAIALRPASTSNLSAWWHASSKNSSNEAGAGADSAVDTDNTVLISTGKYYDDIAPANLTAASTSAAADTNCERTVYYADSVGGTASTYDNGEGYYILYKYYLKSSSNEQMTVSAGGLKAKVTAALQGNGAEAQALDSALRVGIKVGSDTKTTIFAPVSGYDSTYKVAGSTAGATYATVAPIAGNTQEAINTAQLTLPAVSSTTGTEVDVYVWFEGEDTNCKSDNIAATLNSYEITIEFEDADLTAAG